MPAGGGNIGEKTRRYAERFPGARFIGIDLSPPENNKRPENLEQRTADFKEGLDGLEDGSVRAISSEVSLGYYGRPGDVNRLLDHRGVEEAMDRQRRYHNSIVRAAFKKLEPGGRLMFVTSGKKTDGWGIIEALKRGPFKEEKITVRPLRENEYQRTPWLREARKRGLEMVQVTAEK